MSEENGSGLQPPLGLIHTACQGCVWAVRTGRTQTDCERGHIDRHRQKGGRVIEACNHLEEFYLLDGFACQDRRPPLWGLGLSPDERREKLLLERRVRLKVFVRVTSRTELHELTRTLNALVEQTHPIHSVVLLLPAPGRQNFSTQDLLDYLRPLSLSWIIHRPLGEDYPGRDIDQHVRQCASTFYLVLQAGFRPGNTLVEELDRALWEREEKFIYLEPVDEAGNGEMVMTLVHNKLGGNHPAESLPEDGPVRILGPIREKITHIAADQGLEHLLRPAREVCPSLAGPGGT